MAKIRVYELARELKIESKLLLTKMQDLGITVPSHQSTLTVAQIEKIKVNLDAANKATVVVRRRKKAPGSEDSDLASEAGGEEQLPEAVAAPAEAENLASVSSTPPAPTPRVSSNSATVVRRRAPDEATSRVAH
jgi:translation initiation factor IF-2